MTERQVQLKLPTGWSDPITVRDYVPEPKPEPNLFRPITIPDPRGGPDITIKVPIEFPHPDDFVGLPVTTSPIITSPGDVISDIIIDLRGKPDVGFAIGNARDNGRGYRAENVLIYARKDGFKLGDFAELDNVCVIIMDPPAGSHSDAVQCSGAEGARIRNSTLINPYQYPVNAARFGSNVRSVDDCWIEDTFCFGGGISIDFDVKNHPIINSGARRVTVCEGSTSTGTLIRTKGGSISEDVTVLPKSEWQG